MSNNDYVIHTINSPLEILQIFGDDIFPNFEVLSLRNLCGEGTSLTHEEWSVMAEELEFFPHELANYLLERNIIDKNGTK